MRVFIALTALAALCALHAGVNPTTAAEGLSISGTVWHDANLDGVRQGDEQAANQVHLSLVGTGKDASTDIEGHYSFSDLTPGQYQIRLATDAYVVGATYPPRAVNTDISFGINLSASKEDVDFGVVYASELMTIGGSTWIDGAPTENATVRAFVGSTDCTVFTHSIVPPDSGPAFAFTSVAPAGLIVGCGTQGATVSFTINGLPEHETATWSPLSQPLVLTAGHPVALYVSTINVLGIGADAIEAQIDGTACSATYGTYGGFYLAVYSDEQQPGCGSPGAGIELLVNGKEARQTLVWQPGHHEIDFDDFVDESYADLTVLTPPAETTPPPPETAASGRPTPATPGWPPGSNHPGDVGFAVPREIGRAVTST